MHERRQRITFPIGRGRIGFAAIVGAAITITAVPLWIALDPRESEEAEVVDPPQITVPTISQEMLLPEAARGLVERAVNRCRRDQTPEAFAALGRIYHGNGQTRLAAECYEIAIDLGAPDPQTPYFLGLILFDEGRMSEAITRFRAAIGRDSSYPLAHHHLGRSLLQVGQIAAATESLSRAVELDPDDPVLRTGLAKALRQAGRFDEAEAALREALRLDPDHAAAHQLLGLILHATNRPDAAERHLARTQRYNATVYDDPWMWEAYRHAASVEVRVEWARSLLRFGRVESAVGLLGDLAAEHPQNSGVFHALADALLRAGDHQRAIDAFARAAELDPADAQSRLAMAQILLAYDMLSEADDMARRAMAIDPNITEALAVRGTVALREGRPQEARLQLEQVVRARPDYLQAAALLGETLIALQEHEEAVDVLARALHGATGKAVPYAEYQLAVALSRLDRFEEAKDALRRAAAIDPENEHIQQMLAILRERAAP